MLVELLDLDGELVLPHRGDRAQPVDPDALLLGIDCLVLVGGHLVAGPAVDDDGVIGPQPPRHPGRVHRGVAAAVHRNPGSQVRLLPGLDATQEADRVEHPAGVLVGDVDPLGQVGAHRHEGRVEPALGHLGLQILDHVVLLEPDPQVVDAADLRVQHAPRQPVGRDAVPHHAAGQRAVVADHDLVPEPRQVVGRRESAGPGAHHQHPLPRALPWQVEAPVVVDGDVAEEPLHRVDGDRAIHLPPVAGVLAGVVAHAPVDRREGVVPGQLPPRLLVPAGLGQGEPRLDVLPGRAALVAGREEVDVHRPLGAHRSGPLTPRSQRAQRRDVVPVGVVLVRQVWPWVSPRGGAPPGAERTTSRA